MILFLSGPIDPLCSILRLLTQIQAKARASEWWAEVSDLTPFPSSFCLSSPTLDPSLIFPTQGLSTCYIFHLGMFFPLLPLGLLLHLLLVGWYSNILTALLKNFNPPMTCYVHIWYIDTLCIYWMSVSPSANDHHRMWMRWHQRYDSFIQWCTVSGRTRTWRIHGHAPPPPKYWQNEELITNISKICS